MPALSGPDRNGNRKSCNKIGYIDSFYIPLKAPSVNMLYSPLWHLRRMVMNKDAERFRNEVMLVSPMIDIGNHTHLISLTLVFYEPWFFRNNKPKKRDVQNLEKILIDALCSKWGVDDSYIFKKVTYKVDSDDCGIGVCVERTLNYEHIKIRDLLGEGNIECPAKHGSYSWGAVMGRKHHIINWKGEGGEVNTDTSINSSTVVG